MCTNVKVLCVHLLNDYSGSPKVLSQTIKALRAKRIPVDVITCKDTQGFLSGLNVNYRFFEYKFSNNKVLTLVNYLVAQFLIFREVIKYRNENIIVYVNTLLPFGAALAAKFTGKPVIYHVHESSLKPALLKLFLKCVVRYTASKAIYVSSWLGSKESINNVESKVINNALSDEFVNKANVYFYQESKIDDGFTILLVCSLKKYKGIDQYIELANTLIEYNDIKFHLVLNADRDEIESYFSYGLPCNVKIFGRQNDLSEFYQRASLVVNFTLPDECEETFGLTLIEAMAYGNPVIAPPVGGPLDIVNDGENGFSVSAYEIDKLQSRILYLLRNRDEFLKMSQSAKTSSKKYKEEIFNDKVLETILSLNVESNEN